MPLRRGRQARPRSADRGRTVASDSSSSCPRHQSDHADCPLAHGHLPVPPCGHRGIAPSHSCLLLAALPRDVPHPACPGCSKVPAGLGELPKSSPAANSQTSGLDSLLPLPGLSAFLAYRPRVGLQGTKIPLTSCLVTKMICSKKERDLLPLPDKKTRPCLSRV